MDTDDLTEMAYETIRIAEETSRWLTLDLVLSGKNARTESEFLDSMLSTVKEIQEDVPIWIDDNQEEISPSRLRAALQKLERHIRNTIQTPLEERGPTFEGNPI